MREAQRRVSAAEFVEWMAYYAMEPWGCPVEDQRAGTIAAYVHNMAGMVCKQAIGASDVFPQRGEPRKPQTEAERKSIWASIQKLAKGIKR